MPWIVQYLWLIPALPLAAAGAIAVTKQPFRKLAATLAIGSMVPALGLSLMAFAQTLAAGPAARQVYNFEWLRFGPGAAGVLKLGWVLDPLSAVMLVMVTLVALLIFIYSIGYMARDVNYTRFFCFLSLFAGAMLGLVMANSLLLLFVCWELVGLTSYLLIGFWYEKPSAAAAATKAFITTRVGDLALLLGLVWWFGQCGTLLFYDNGAGCLESAALAGIIGKTTILGLGLSTAIGLLIFAGAVGKSGQVPLHVWLPDAMEGPTPVSALIHAATMVAAGVFLVARVFPLMSLEPAALMDNVGAIGTEGAGVMVLNSSNATPALLGITWVGAITAVFAASIAVAQTDIKRILAYSTVSQLGYMMLGLGVGGVAVGLFHLITHAFFKALLFLGAGSVIHGCGDEQDIRFLGGLRKLMPVTFATYAIGMLALAGFPLVFSGFWSKDAILHAALNWDVSKGPFYLGLFGALLTAFYMTRQVVLVFFGASGRRRRAQAQSGTEHGTEISEPPHVGSCGHESPLAMTGPLVLLALGAIGLSAMGTPAWPWFEAYINGERATVGFQRFQDPDVVLLMLVSSAIVIAGMFLGWWLYGRRPLASPAEPDPLERLPGGIWVALRNKWWVDEMYEQSVVALNAWWTRVCAWLEAWVWDGAVLLVQYGIIGLSWVNRWFDEAAVNAGFDEGCRGVTFGGKVLSRLQDGRVQHYLRVIGVGLAVLALLLIWRGSG